MTPAPETVLVVTADAETVLLVAKQLLLQLLSQPQLLQSKRLQLLSNSEQHHDFETTSSGRWFKGAGIQQSLR